MQKPTQVLLAIFAACLLLAGCGSSSGSGGSAGTGPALGTSSEGVSYVGANTCINCHEDFSWSADEVAGYLEGKHVIHSTHVSATSDSVCLECHDPIGDGTLIQDKIDAANVPAGDLAAVTCEACHGAGGDHYGVSPITTAEPGPDTCAQCHDKQWETIAEASGHLTYHPEGNGIYSDYAASRHAVGSVRGEAVCAKCHTDEGAKANKDIHSITGLATVASVDNASSIQCRTCHDPHNAGKLLEDKVTAYNHTTHTHDVVQSSEDATCTNCHQNGQVDLAATDPVAVPGTSSSDGGSGDLIYHATRYDRVIASNHYDDPTTTDVIEGFVVNKASDRACRDCHNVHSGDVSINEQWADSGHAAHIAVAKDAAAASETDRTLAQAQAVEQAGVDPASSDAELAEAAAAFTHWSTVPGDSCQKCHSATGAKNYLSDPVNYDPADNDFSYLQDGQHELLYCWGCHKNNVGGLNQPGAITADYNFNGAAATFPDEDASNVCIACHAGRESGESVEAITDFTNASFKNSHYMAVAGTMFVKDGYTNFVPANTPVDAANPTTSDSYGQSLTSDSDTTVDVNGATVAGKLTSTHRKLGTADLVGSHGITADQTNMIEGGPCIACHMQDRDENGQSSHTWEIDANAYTKSCGNCHTAESGTPLTKDNFDTVFLEPNSDAFMAAINLAEIELNNNYGIVYDSANYPYFFPASATVHDHSTGVKDWTLGSTLSAADAEKLMGACFNINLLNREPAAYAHARTYSRRLLYDTVDFLDNGTIDQSVSTVAFADDTAEFTKGTTAYDGGPPYMGGTLNAGTTEGAAFILGWGHDGSWNSPERP